jgi:hypothetical protein
MNFNVRKGTLYNEDGSIKYEGEWIEDRISSLSFSEKEED